MDYQKIYQSIIERAKSRNIEGYVERHHILPRCMKGSDDESNLVALTAREHFICHWLLMKMFPKNHKLKRAFAMMAFMKSGNQKRYRCSSRVFEIARKAKSEAMKGVNNPRYGKPGTNLGKTLSAEHRAKIGAAQKDRKLSDETKDKMSASKKGTKNYLFKGWYCTPCGRFSSLTEAAGPNNTSRSSIGNWCKSGKPGFSFEPVEK